FLSLAEQQAWDVMLMALTLPDAEAAFALFGKLRTHTGDTPIIAASRPMEVYQLARLVGAGLHSHIMRDAGGDYIFLLMPTLQAAFEAVAAERSRKLAERLRQEIESVRRLQESVIPRNIQAPTGYTVAARYEPSQIQVLGSRPVVMAG